MASLGLPRHSLLSAASLAVVAAVVVGWKGVGWPVFLPPPRGRFMNGRFGGGALNLRWRAHALPRLLPLLLLNREGSDQIKSR